MSENFTDRKKEILTGFIVYRSTPYNFVDLKKLIKIEDLLVVPEFKQRVRVGGECHYKGNMRDPSGDKVFCTLIIPTSFSCEFVILHYSLQFYKLYHWSEQGKECFTQDHSVLFLKIA